MKKENYLENYPIELVVLSALVSLLIYVAGALIVYLIGLMWLILYLACVGILEFRVIRGHCVNCYYYGKTCAFGRGRLSGMLFQKGDVKEFCKKQVTWKDIAPDFMVALIPAIIGTIILIKNFNWFILSLVLTLLILTFVGNAVVRSQFACKYCMQRKIGCPAQKLFEKGS